jgi:hypothetical protein
MRFLKIRFIRVFALQICVVSVQIQVLKKNIGLSLLVKKKLSDLVPSWQKHKK